MAGHDVAVVLDGRKPMFGIPCFGIEHMLLWHMCTELSSCACCAAAKLLCTNTTCTTRPYLVEICGWCTPYTTPRPGICGVWSEVRSKLETKELRPKQHGHGIKCFTPLFLVYLQASLHECCWKMLHLPPGENCVLCCFMLFMLHKRSFLVGCS